MNAVMEQVAANISKNLNGLGRGDFKVEARSNYGGGGLDNQNQTPATLELTITNEGLETDPTLQALILAQLSQIPALAGNVQFETDRKHAENLAKRLREFIKDGAQIPESFAAWFEQMAKKDAQQRPDHTVQITKKDTGITVSLDVPKDADPAAIQKNLEARMDAIKSMLAERVVKYTPEATTEEQKQTLRAKIMALDFAVSASKTDYGSLLSIDILSKEQLAAAKQNQATGYKGPTLSADETKALRDSNPLNALKDGEGNDAQLQKAVARSVLFAGDKAVEVFPIIAGREDMKRAVIKPLVRLAQAKPEMAEKVKSFIEDDTFKKHENWVYSGGIGTSNNSAEGGKQQPRIVKTSAIKTADGSEKYTPGQITVSLDLPANKFKAIVESVAGVAADERNLMTLPIGELTPAELEQVAPQRAAELSADQIAALPEAVRAQVMTAAAAQQQASALAPDLLAQVAGGQVVAAQPGIDGKAAEAAAQASGQVPLDAGTVAGFLREKLATGPKGPMEQAQRAEAPAAGRGAA
jgi:hypothetical protein